MRNCVWLVCVDGASILWAHHVWIDIESICATTSTITVRVVVGGHIFTCVKCRCHSVLVTFKSVIFRTIVVVYIVCIAVVVTIRARLWLEGRIVAWKLAEICSCIAVTPNLTYINVIAKPVPK